MEYKRRQENPKDVIYEGTAQKYCGNLEDNKKLSVDEYGANSVITKHGFSTCLYIW